MNQIVEEVSQHVINLFKAHPALFVYHNLHHTREVVDLVQDLAENSGVESDELEFLLIAAWFHDIGYPETIPLHEERSAEMAEEFLRKKDYPQEKIDAVKKLILSTKVPQNPENDLEKIMCDADIAYIGKKDFISRIDLLRKEWQQTIQRNFSNSEWIRENIRFLESNSFHTEYAKRKFGQTRKENLAELKQLLEEEKGKS